MVALDKSRIQTPKPLIVVVGSCVVFQVSSEPRWGRIFRPEEVYTMVEEILNAVEQKPTLKTRFVTSQDNVIVVRIVDFPSPICLILSNDEAHDFVEGLLGFAEKAELNRKKESLRAELQGYVGIGEKIDKQGGTRSVQLNCR